MTKKRTKVADIYPTDIVKERLRDELIDKGLKDEGIKDILEYTEALIEELNSRGLSVAFPDLKMKPNKKREKEIRDFVKFWESNNKLKGIGLYLGYNKPLKFNDPFVMGFLNDVIDFYKEQKKDHRPINRLADMELVEESFYSNQIVILTALIKLHYRKQGDKFSLRHINLTSYRVFEILGCLPERDEDNSNPFIYGHLKSFFKKELKLPMKFNSERLAIISAKSFSTFLYPNAEIKTTLL